MANRIYVSIDGKLKGYFQVQSTYREGFSSLIDKLNQYKLHLLTGDHSKTEQQKFEDDYNQKLVLSFDKGPMEKLDYIKSLQNAGDKVMMIGDGLNDSGALQKSDVGIAVSDNTALFTPASDGILKGSNMNKLYQFLLLARGGKKIVIASFVLSFLYNTVGLGLAVSGLLTPLVAAILMPLSSVTVVVFSTLNVNMLAKKLKLS
ncbi:MAG: HAD-IC family P-type ATPase [Bacteroidetes bacterium]|nr:HAD-IC family P-type ATPase [Bacteroidota bacterium]MDA1120950.1 HAD-IC family P-type ATPase [Bacteroidota bacterium]